MLPLKIENMNENKEYDQSIINLLRWHYHFDLEQCETILEAHKSMNKYFWLNVGSPTYFPVKCLVAVLKAFDEENKRLALAGMIGAEAGKMLRNVLLKLNTSL